jgi:Fe-S cluster assembly ATP-binding protein
MLKIKNLSVKVKKKTILKKVNLEIKKGEIHALLGPNASGKSTLCFALLGLSHYQVSQGKIFFDSKDITHWPPEKRAKIGLALGFQQPPVIRGVKLKTLLEEIAKKPQKEILPKELLWREVNIGFSGGERKLAEITQILALKPKLVILDEIDSGLDPKNLEKIIRLIKKEFLQNDVSLLLVSHHGEIFRFLKPDFVHVMVRGEIICTSKNWQKVYQTIREHDYEKCKGCSLLAS